MPNNTDQPVGAVPARPSEPLSSRWQELFWALPSGPMRSKLRTLEIDTGQRLRDLTAALAAATQERDESVDAEGDRITEALVAFPELDLDPNNGDGVDSADPADWLRSMISASIVRAVERAEADAESQVQALRALLGRIVDEMRNEGPRYKSHDLGFVDSVSANRVDEWADELDQILSSPSASNTEAKG